MRCLLGKKKHRKCEEISGYQYLSCLVRGGDTHYHATCVRKGIVDGRAVTDIVNYKTGEVVELDVDAPAKWAAYMAEMREKAKKAKQFEEERKQFQRLSLDEQAKYLDEQWAKIGEE